MTPPGGSGFHVFLPRGRAYTDVAMMTLTPLGDQAILARFPDERSAASFAGCVRAAGPPWLFDVVCAYTTVAVFFDADATSYLHVEAALRSAGTTRPGEVGEPGKLHRIPCCYERQLDMGRVCERTGLTEDAVVALHTGTEFRIFAIGFCPGFPYLGYLPEPLRGVPRLDSPRLKVEPGSVGLTATQTGVYPLARPGGWNLIGRTPLELVNLADGYFPLRVGDRVRFERIDEAEFVRLAGERLEQGSTSTTENSGESTAHRREVPELR